MPNTSETDEKKFNETLKRMLQTPPKPHDKPAPQEKRLKNEAKRPASQKRP